MHLLDLYFIHAGHATYGMFPRRPFLAWVESNRDKSQEHLMLLYSVLAVGTLFLADGERRTLGRRFASIASYAAEKQFGKFTLQLCQTRLLLALYYFAWGKSEEAWDYCGAGLRALSALNLNSEEGVKALADRNADQDYGFDHRTYTECCRRTFWSGLLLDVSHDVVTTHASADMSQQQRYPGFFGGTLSVISLEDAFIQLPCLDNMYDASTPCDAPFFDDELLSGSASRRPVLGHMAYLCVISALWGEVLTFFSRAVRRPDSAYERHYDSFYMKMNLKLDAWHAMLPDNLRYTPRNLDHSILDGYVGTFLSIHALYHATIIRLNRQVRVSVLSMDKTRRNLERILRMASNFLSMMLSLAPINRQRRPPPTVLPDFTFSMPFLGYTLMLSVDVLTSAGLNSSLPTLTETLNTTLTCIDELASFWASAKAQQKAVSNRIKQLTDIAAQEGQSTRNGNYGNFWRISNSLETALGNDDALYKAEDQLLFGVVGQLTGQ
jgi:hypothetical protein